MAEADMGRSRRRIGVAGFDPSSMGLGEDKCQSKDESSK